MPHAKLTDSAYPTSQISLPAEIGPDWIADNVKPISLADQSEKKRARRRRLWARWMTYGGVFYLVLAVSLGMLTGLGFFTFGYAEGASYLKDDPTACINCHVMQDHYDSWLKSSHAHVATCNDCHLSHHAIGKWVTKSDNGFFHSIAFTLDNYDRPIKIKTRNREVTQKACLHCHGDLVHEIASIDDNRGTLYCFTCHSDVGHGQNMPRITVHPEEPRRP